MEEILKELIDLSRMHSGAEEEMSHEEFKQFLESTLHPLEDQFETKVPGFYILYAEEYKMYGLFPVDC